jgi:hypothetical protein
MVEKLNPLYDRTDKYQFTDAAWEVLGRQQLRKLRDEWDAHTSPMVFGEFLHKHHPEVFVRLLAWMKINGKW